MFQFMHESSGKLLALKVSGKLHHEDYEQLTPYLERLIQQYGTLRIFCHLEDFKGWDPRALCDDLRLGVRYRKNFERCAIVGQQQWQAWLTRFGGWMMEGEARFFQENEMDAAWNWLKEEK